MAKRSFLVRRQLALWYDVIGRDVAYAARLIRKRRGAAALAVSTLAVAVGLNAAVFSVVDDVLLRELPLPMSERLVYLNGISPPPHRQPTRVSPAAVLEWQRESRTLDALAAFSFVAPVVLTNAGAVRVQGAAVSPGFFEVFPVKTAAGRLLMPPDFTSVARASDDAGRAPARFLPAVAVISHALWQRQFGGRADIVGHAMRLRQFGNVEVVGVLEKDFAFPLYGPIDVWLPEPLEPTRHARYLLPIGRLAPGVTMQEAQAEFDILAARLAVAAPERGADFGAKLQSLRERVTAPVRPLLWFLGATALCVLLIALANLSSLLLIQTSGRRREFATRVALGATTSDLVRLTVIEGLAFALLGGLGGLLAAQWALPVLLSGAPSMPRAAEVVIGPRVWLGAGGAILLIGVIGGALGFFGAQAGRVERSLRSRGTAGAAGGRRFRRALVIVQIGAALLLVMTATLLARTMRTVSELPLGFEPDGAIAVGFSADSGRVRRSGGRPLFESNLSSALRSIPGVSHAGIGPRPLGPGLADTAITVPKRPDVYLPVDQAVIGPGYLEALGARLRAGRVLLPEDRRDAMPVALVNETAATRYLDSDAVGRQVLLNGILTTIVGVVEDVRLTGLERDPAPVLFVPSAQTRTVWPDEVIVRTDGDPRTIVPAIRTVMRELDRELPVVDIELLQERVSAAMAGRRFALLLVGVFAAVALGLALLGIYGVMMAAVTERVPEIGVRMVLGASPARIRRMIASEGAWLVGSGITVGIGAALAASGVLAAFVFGVSATDPATVTLAAIAVALSGMLAGLLPAHRAARVDPAATLRGE